MWRMGWPAACLMMVCSGCVAAMFVTSPGALDRLIIGVCATIGAFIVGVAAVVVIAMRRHRPRPERNIPVRVVATRTVRELPR